MEDRIERLISGFRVYVEGFNRTPIFTGPSLYFHLRTIEKLRGHSSPAAAVVDNAFLESLYATLTAWGMHRMGPGGAKLADFNDFKKGFQSQQSAIRTVENVLLRDAQPEQVANLGRQIMDIISKLTVGVGQTKIVSGSKALHHVLPELVVPIDREYTLRFFYGHKTLTRGDVASFEDMFPRFHKIATACTDEIDSELGRWNEHEHDKGHRQRDHRLRVGRDQAPEPRLGRPTMPNRVLIILSCSRDKRDGGEPFSLAFPSFAEMLSAEHQARLIATRREVMSLLHPRQAHSKDGDVSRLYNDDQAGGYRDERTGEQEPGSRTRFRGRRTGGCIFACLSTLFWPVFRTARRYSPRLLGGVASRYRGRLCLGALRSHSIERAYSELRLSLSGRHERSPWHDVG